VAGWRRSSRRVQAHANAFRRTQNIRPVWRWVREGREGARRRSGGVVASPWKACGKNSAKAGEGRLVPMFPKAGALKL